METATDAAFRWTLRPVPDEAQVAALSASLNQLPAPLARALVVRGVGGFEAARRFFRAGLDGLHDPFLMRDMDRAAERLAQAIETGERVLVYGDYDVDGTTSTALMTLFLRAHGVEADFFVPNRFEHGYGLGEAGFERAVALGATLVVALDCGITAIEEAARAREMGLDLVICDHHEPGEVLPEAVAVLDPKRPDCPYPFDGLSGCGVGFKLIQATLHRLGRPAEAAWSYLDLVAVSTASDIVPVVDENRILMREGLRQLCRGRRPGLAMLAARAGVDLATCTASRIVFNLGPRINAAGRLDDASLAVDLLLTDDVAEAARLADRIEALNERRRALDHQTRDEALRQAEAFMAADPLALVLHDPGWHPGVIGITASRVAERFHRPAVLLTAGEDGLAKGSARSVKGISIYQALASCPEGLLVRFGGHDFAAGLALPVEDIPALREHLNAAVAEAVADPGVLTPELEIDAHLALTDIDDRFWRVLSQFGPYGPDNPHPLFWGRDLRVVGSPTTVGADGRHLKLRVAQRGGGAPFSVIGFGLGDRLGVALKSVRRGRPLELAFCVEENHWNGRTSLQLRAKDVRLQDDDEL
ncbi:MAG: single-stranded-DNA-specific exonuclease RecJ [Rubricoccaceae bacterium]|nr:single-stranded-DNA-specific exonuclease RecJ [Rubricoccaceae bacterium]